jgi:hypothetical protein
MFLGTPKYFQDSVPSTSGNKKHNHKTNTGNAANNADALQTCNALYLDTGFSEGDNNEWELPPLCSCSISVRALLRHVSHLSLSLFQFIASTSSFKNFMSYKNIFT